jgi:hypothetical protein
MSARYVVRSLACALLVVALSTPLQAQLVNSEWNTGSGAWNIPTNWFPNDVPDNGGGLTYDVEIGNRPVAVNAAVTLVPEDGTSDTITSLTVSGGADLQTNGNALFVTGQTTISGVGSSIFVEPATGGGIAFNSDNLDINSNSALQMAGGTVDVDVLLEVNSGSITGHGLIIVGDADGVVEVGLENSANIFVGNASNAVLTLQANGVDTLDLDGTTETGTLDVANVNANVGFDTLTLIVDGPLADAFGGTLLVGQRDTVTFNNAFTMDGADVQLDGGVAVATINGPGNATSIQNSTFTVTGDAAISNDLIFSGAGNLVTINANSSLTLGGVVSLPPASFNFASSSAELIVTGSFNANVVGDDFNWDGPGTATTTIDGGSMTLNVDHVDTGNDTYGGTLNLVNGGDLSVNNTANEWTAAGVINKNGAGTSSVTGDRVIITGAVNVNAGTLDLPAVTTTPTTNVNATGTLILGSSSVFGGGTLAGTGLLRMEGTSSVSANTTINVATFDWDGLGTGTNHTINDGVVFTINSPILDSDGDMDDPFNLAGSGSQLIVNGPTQWTATAGINANNAGVGTATIGGTSRLILSGVGAELNVNGGTVISAPITFGADSSASIDAGMTLNVGAVNATYSGGAISGLGTYSPGSTNTVTANSSITAATFDFDGGSWTIEPSETLTINVTDYDTTATNAFDSTITLNDGEINVSTGDAEFVMDGVLNMVSNGVDLAFAEWTGEPLDIGNDAGTLDADLNVSGSFFSRISAAVDFNSDADVNVTDGVTLAFGSSVNFDTVNGGNNAEFTGNGTLSFHGLVNVNEAVTLNMVGGGVDLDGGDTVGDFVNVDAPMTINTATMASFGRVNSGGGTNTLDVNNSVGTGVLTVNLDDPNAEWTLNGPGVMNLVNDNTEATLLAGSDMNINGTVNVTGDVRSAARLDIAGVINVNTAGQPLRLAGGNNFDNPNTIAGGTISGVGILGADAGRALRGFGTINTFVDFDGTANLEADNGTLTVNAAIQDVGTVGTNDADGVLHVTNAWNTAVADNVRLIGGTLSGGAMTVDNANGVFGGGLVSARVINNTQLRGALFQGTFVFQTSLNDNDWDGTTNVGSLRADNQSTLELRDVGAAFAFAGSVVVDVGSRVFTNGFALDFNPGSSISLTNGTYESTNSTDIGGTVTIVAGAPSTIKVKENVFLSFEPTSTTTLNSNLVLQNNNIIIESGATFSGTGALIIDEPSHSVLENGANVNVLLVNEGAIRPGNSQGIGTATLKDYVQTSTGELFLELTGTLPNQYDRLLVSQTAQVDGYLNIDLDEVSPGVPFNPALGATFDIISSAFGVTGAFDTIDFSGLPAGKAFAITYLPNSVRLTTVVKPEFAADFDDDGDVDATDYQIWVGAYALNQLGDANGDNISDAADYTVWRDTLGSGPSLPSVAIPEPTAVVLLALASGLPLMSRRR